MKYFFLSLLISLLGFNCTYAQNKESVITDSLWAKYNKNDRNDTDKLVILYDLASTLMNKRPDSTLKIIEMAKQLSIQLDSLKFFDFVNIESTVYDDYGDYSKSFELLSEALAFSKKNGDSLHQSGLLMNSAMLIADMGDSITALEMLQDALEIAPAFAYDVKGLIYLNLAVYSAQKELYNRRKAIHYLEKNLEESYIKKYVRIYRPLITAYYNYSITIETQDSSEYYLKKALDTANAYSIKPMESYCLRELGRRAFKMGEIEKALKFAKQAFRVANESLNLDNQYYATKFLSEIFSTINDSSKAFKYYEASIKFRDSLQNIAHQREILEIRYQSKIRENELQFKRLESQEKFKRYKDRFLSISFSALLIILLLVYFSLRNLKIKNEKTVLLNEIRHLKDKLFPKEVVSSMDNLATQKLNREKIEKNSDSKINDTDWKILNVLYDDPLIVNKLIAEEVLLSVEGVSSSLRKMYKQFDISADQNKKLSLLKTVIELSGL